MNGEPFCYGSRLTVRQLLELRSNGYDLTRILTDHPELKTMGVAAAFAYAGDHRERYADFFEPDGSLTGPGYSRGRGGRPARPVPAAGHRRQGRLTARLGLEHRSRTVAWARIASIRHWVIRSWSAVPGEPIVDDRYHHH